MGFEEDEHMFNASISHEDSGLENGTLSDSSSTSYEHNETLHETKPARKSLQCRSTYNISGLEIKTLSERTFSYMATYIKEVNLSKNRISALPDTLGTLKNLEELDLSRNLLSDLPESMKNLRKLRSLNISGNKFSTLPLCFENGMEFITILDLSDNRIERPPKEPLCLPRLKSLKIKNNNLLSVPLWLFGDKCRSLIELDVSFNFCFDSKTLSKEIQLAKHHRSSALKSLKLLNVFNTGVTKELLSYLDTFEHLEVLHIGNSGESSKAFNYFDDLPTNLLYDPSTVVELNLAKVGIATVSNSINKLVHLKVLNLAENEIPWLPDCFGSLNFLEELVLSKCHTTLLPESFNKLTNLKKLLLDHNQVTEVSQHLQGLESLEWLDLYDNLLEEFPLSVEHMSRLKKLDVAHNYFDIQESLMEKTNGVSLCEHYLKLQNNLRSSNNLYSGRSNSSKATSLESNASSDSVISHSRFQNYESYASDDSYSSQDEEDYHYADKQTDAFIQEEEEEVWCNKSSNDDLDLITTKRLPLVQEWPYGKKYFGWKPRPTFSTGLPECKVPLSQRVTGFIFVPADTHLKPLRRTVNVRDVSAHEGQFSDVEMPSGITCS